MITMVDRHDGTRAGTEKRDHRDPYLLRWVVQDTSISTSDVHKYKPHQRELVGLNAAGFVLFDRNWDYQGGGVNAVGPTEEFVYEAIKKDIHAPDGMVDTPEIPGATTDEHTYVLTGMRLKEHRSMGWGVAYTRAVNTAGCVPCVSSGSNSCLTDTRGLVTKFGYKDFGTPGTTNYRQTNLVESVSIKEGISESGSRLKMLSRIDYNNTTEQVESERRYVLKEDGSPDPVIISERRVAYHDSENTKIKWETNWQSPAKAWPGGPEMTPFDTRVWNDTGLLIGRVYGLCGSISSTGIPEVGDSNHAPAARFSVDVYGYNSEGQKRIEIVDAGATAADPVHRIEWGRFTTPGTNPYSPLPLDNEVTGYVEQLTGIASFAVRRVPAGEEARLPALNRVTGYGYGGRGDLEIVAKPGGRFDFYVMHTAIVPGPDQTTPVTPETIVGPMLSIVYVDGTFTGSTLSFGRAGQIASISGGRPMRTWSVEWTPTTLNDWKQPSFVTAGAAYATPQLPRDYFILPLPPNDALGPPPEMGSNIPTSRFKTIAEVRPEYDDSGRPTKVGAKGLASPDGQPIVSATDTLERKANYTDFGLVSKRVEPSGTIHRMVTSPLGQLIAEFKGTGDHDSCWQNTSSGSNDMALTARHFYGEGINNIRQPVLTRHYRNWVKCDQVDYQGRGASGLPSDNTGWEEAYGYDRRGRRSVMEVYGPAVAGMSGLPRPGPSPSGGYDGEAEVASSSSNVLLRAEYTWYDHQDRVRFRATYSGAALQTNGMAGSPVNPRTRDVYLKGDPLAKEILDTHPARLTETIYDARGAVEEEREYDAGNDVAALRERYQASRMYYDHAGHVTTRVSAGGRWERMTYDALGRLVSTSVLRGDLGVASGTTSDENRYEVERTDNEYNENGQVERTAHVVRVLLGTAGIGSTVDQNERLEAGPGGNAVRTDSLTWYDKDGRAIASAMLGTGCGPATDRPNGMFCNTSAAVPVGPSRSTVYQLPPTWGGVSGWTWGGSLAYPNAQISTTTYDASGRVSETRAPNGSSTTRYYDGLNRVVREFVMPGANAAAAVPVPTTVTAYKYKGEKLWKMAAIRPGNPSFAFNGPDPSFDNNGERTLQITELVYGKATVRNASGAITAPGESARIVNADSTSQDYGTAFSADYDLLRGIRFPKGALCGCDINGGGMSVNDIFDYLTAWFSGCRGTCPGPDGAICNFGNGCIDADFNRNGTLNVQDIFDFLSCWFSSNECGHQWNLAANENVDILFEYTLDGLVYSRQDLSHMDPVGTAAESPTKIVFGYDTLGRRTDMKVAKGGVDVADSIEHVSYTYDVLDRLTRVRAEARDREHGSCLYPVATSIFTHDSWGNLTGERLMHGGVNETIVQALQYQWEYSIAPNAPPTPGSAPVVARLSRMTHPVSAGADAAAASSRGVVSYGYGDGYNTSTNGASPAAWLDNLLHRVQTMAFNPSVDSATGAPSGTPKQLANYMYAGAGMRLSTRYGPSPTGGSASQPYAAIQDSSDIPTTAILSGAGPGMSGLDGFGRATDIHYKTGSTYQVNGSATLARRQLVYDRIGNLTREQVTQQAYSAGGGSGITTGSDRSWAYSYDGLGRLTSAATGTFGANWANLTGLGSGTGIVNTATNSTPFAALPGNSTVGTAKTMDARWTLDDLGNWKVGATTGGDATNGLWTRTFDGGDLRTEARRGHRTDDRNQIGQTIAQRMVDETPDEHAVEVKYAYDGAGRMRYDGRVLYEHDSFGRLVQVRGANSEFRIDEYGVLQPVSVSDIGALVVHYSYDGLGRVIRTQRPASSGSTAPGSNPAGGGKLFITDLYYDGVRVVQEAGWGGNQSSGGGGGVPYRMNRNASGALDVTMPGLPRRANEMSGANSGDVSWGDCAPTATGTNNGGWVWQDRRLEREYVWASDSGAYVDECVAQLVYTDAHVPASGSTSEQSAYKGNDTSATILYTLADHNANVIGLTDSIGRLVGQFSYTPYGEIRAAEYFAPDQSSLTNQELTAAARGNKLGHQGLRTERFDRPWDGAMDVTTAQDAGGNPAITAYRALCHNRNRMYDPAEGRFIEQDPNGLGVPIIGDIRYHGESAASPSSWQDVANHYAHSMNTHTAYRNRPVLEKDSLGLWINPSDVAAAAVMGVVRGLRGGLEAITSVYADNLDYDIDWAQDWNAPDNWHSRNDNTWVEQAWNEGVRGGLREWVNQDVKGLYDPFNFTPDPIPAEQAMAANVPHVAPPSGTWRLVARTINGAGYAAHHVISFYKNTARRAKDLEEKYGITIKLHSVDNMVGISKSIHKGRHTLAYHDRVFAKLKFDLNAAKAAGRNLQGAFEDSLRSIARDIDANPGHWFAP